MNTSLKKDKKYWKLHYIFHELHPSLQSFSYPSSVVHKSQKVKKYITRILQNRIATEILTELFTSLHCAATHGILHAPDTSLRYIQTQFEKCRNDLLFATTKSTYLSNGLPYDWFPSVLYQRLIIRNLLKVDGSDPSKQTKTHRFNRYISQPFSNSGRLESYSSSLDFFGYNRQESIKGSIRNYDSLLNQMTIMVAYSNFEEFSLLEVIFA